MSEPLDRGFLVDSNVLLDIASEDPAWAEWSSGALADALRAGHVVVNPVIYAEVSVGFPTIDDVEAALPVALFQRAPLPYRAAFLAGKAFLAYRRREGEARSPLPDFHIGAHAAVAGLTLITRDARRYRTYFPTVPLVTPH